MISPADWFAGLSLLFIGVFGIVLHLIEMSAMTKLTCRYVGFRFILSQSVADVLMLIQFGVWPGVVVFTKNSLIAESMRTPVHIYMDGVWFSVCYMSVVISITRLVCVKYPMQFRQLRHRTCFYISVGAWLLAFGQSVIVHSMSWFVSLHYDEEGYGMTGDWEKHATQGTQTYYLVTSVVIVATYLVVYSIAAVLIVMQRNMILRLTRPKGTSTTNLVNGTRSSIIRRNQAIAVELRLMIPCAASAVIYIIGQILINGGVGQGKWTGYAVMVIFSLQSLVNPILRIVFSETLRCEIYRVFCVKAGKLTTTPLFTVNKLVPSLFLGPTTTVQNIVHANIMN
uniref:G_PROTEIN_RECEP_F1_2 domain-containing protein n=1 Tax=Steinernema glaseri TaxID=37863 RepID=A0A1I8AUT9_9BILA